MINPRPKLKAVVGDYNRICDKSGFNFKRSELIREERTGLLVHPDFADPVHPSDLPERIVDKRFRIE